MVLPLVHLPSSKIRSCLFTLETRKRNVEARCLDFQTGYILCGREGLPVHMALLQLWRIIAPPIWINCRPVHWCRLWMFDCGSVGFGNDLGLCEDNQVSHRILLKWPIETERTLIILIWAV